MGNSASNASNPPSRTIRAPSPSPSPGNPHPSLRTKKKSLELPDLASLSLPQNHHHNTRGRQAKTASIPIPTSPASPFNHYQQAQQTQRAPRHLPSTADVNPVPQHPNHPPFPPAPRPNPSAPRGRQQPISHRQQQQQVTRMQELYNQSQQPTNPPSPSRQTFQQETVRSSIPVALTKALPNEIPPADEILEQEYPQKEDLLADFAPVKIVWRGGGTHVVLARAGDDEWKGRQLMEKESVFYFILALISNLLYRSANVWTLNVMLRPGTHHVRFLVDGQWRVADDLPAAVDDQGSLANYVAVPIPAPLPPPLPVTRDKLVPGQSFWSADSSADGESEHHHLHHYQQQQQQPQQTSPSHNHTSHSQSGNWTNILPPELIEAAREEEVYLSASAGQYESATRVTTGFVPAPNIPPAPGLPRHLEKLILNTRVSAGLPGVAGAVSSAAGGGTGARSGSGQAMGGVGVMGVGSGQGQAARKERRDRERDGDRERRDGDKRERERDRDGERDRDRDRGTRRRAPTTSAVVNIPPPPPPSEDGGYLTQGVGTTSLPETGTTGVESTESSSTTTPNAPTPISTNTNTATTTPQTSLPTTPVVPMSPVQGVSPPGKTCAGGENGIGTEASPTMSPATQHSIPNVSAPASTSTSVAASANTSATASPNPNALFNNPSSTIPSSTSTPPSIPISTSTSTTYPYTTPSGSRTITIDTSIPSLTDDGSVLPVPSHVVLHHLSTSAIRNGVLAVGNTIRYRKKVSTPLFRCDYVREGG